MFLFENSTISYSRTIRGVRYITNSFYGGDKDIFQKIQTLITAPSNSYDLPEVTKESLLGSGMASAAD